MSGGDSTVDEMIRSTERGLLLTRFWYIRGVDPRTILYTGLTRDGTFLIENGEISHPVKNFRWNESPIFMLNNIEMMGEPVRISSGESSGLTSSVVGLPAVWRPGSDGSFRLAARAWERYRFASTAMLIVTSCPTTMAAAQLPTPTP